MGVRVCVWGGGDGIYQGMHCLGCSQEVCSPRNCLGTLGINLSLRRLTLVNPSLIINCI